MFVSALTEFFVTRPLTAFCESTDLSWLSSRLIQALIRPAVHPSLVAHSRAESHEPVARDSAIAAAAVAGGTCAAGGGAAISTDAADETRRAATFDFCVAWESAPAATGARFGEAVGVVGFAVGVALDGFRTTTGPALTAAPAVSTSAAELVSATAHTTATLATTVDTPPIANRVRLSKPSSPSRSRARSHSSHGGRHTSASAQKRMRLFSFASTRRVRQRVSEDGSGQFARFEQVRDEGGDR